MRNIVIRKELNWIKFSTGWRDRVGILDRKKFNCHGFSYILIKFQNERFWKLFGVKSKEISINHFENLESFNYKNWSNWIKFTYWVLKWTKTNCWTESKNLRLTFRWRSSGHFSVSNILPFQATYKIGTTNSDSILLR